MADNAKKTEHSGAKHGRGAYWGHRQDAKKESRRARREAAKKEIRTSQVSMKATCVSPSGAF